MTKGDIVRQEGSPYLVEELCYAMAREIRQKNFSLTYLRDKADLLKRFVDGLRDGSE